MLVLTRKRGETLVIGDDIKAPVPSVRGDLARVGIDASKSVLVHRQEVLLDVEQLGQLLHKSPHSIRSDRVRNPQALPPTCRLPGHRRLLWRRVDVDVWLAEHVIAPAPAPPAVRRSGRPTKAEQVRRALQERH